MTDSPRKPTRRSIAVNRKARFEYELTETFEAGIELVGSEVKSLRAGKIHFTDSFADFDDGELWLRNVNIAEYGPANRFNHDPVRKRRLLLHRHELAKLQQATREAGMTIVPVEFYFLGQRVKVEIAVARGKKLHDKRESIKEREATREMARARRGDR